MNANKIVTESWSNPDSERRYLRGWPQEPKLTEFHERGWQCGACSYYGEFNTGFGLCCHPQSRHVRETVHKHFTCPAYVDECWGPHSFSTPAIDHCTCHGVAIVRNATSHEQALETKALLKILSIGNREVEANRITTAAAATKRLRDKKGDS